MKLYFPGPGEARVTLDSGHVALVGQEPRELPEFMHAAAMAAGCLPEGVGKPVALVEPKGERDDNALRVHLLAIADAAKPGTVDAEGRPLPDAVRDRIGYHVSDVKIYQTWALIEQEVTEDAPPPPPIVELSDAQVTLISELSQAGVRTLKERLVDVTDPVVLQEVHNAELRAEKPRTSIVDLLAVAIAKAKSGA